MSFDCQTLQILEDSSKFEVFSKPAGFDMARTVSSGNTFHVENTSNGQNLTKKLITNSLAIFWLDH